MTRFISLLLLMLLFVTASFAQAARKGRRAVSQKTATPKQTPEKKSETPPAKSYQQLAEEAAQARNSLMTATENYLASLEKLKTMYADEETRAAAQLEKRRELVTLGVIARRELEKDELRLTEARKKSDNVTRQIGEANQMIAEVIALEEDSKKSLERKDDLTEITRSRLVMIKYTGTTFWSLANDAGKVQNFFLAKFGRQLPVSAWGQSGTHDALGFDHHNAFDVALQPDSVEGRALMEWLRSQGIPFIAFRAAVAGSATGVHIHIGPPSRRITAKL